MIYTHIIWDFNGTLFDDVAAGIEAVNDMLARRGYKTLSGKEEYREVFRFPIIDYYRALGFDFEREPYEVLAPEWVELYNRASESSTLSAGALEALDIFREWGIPQVLLSATERQMLVGQIRGLGIEEYFCEVLGLGNIHAYSKKDLAVLWKQRNPQSVPIIIGDTEHDAEVARAIGCDCVLVRGGHQSEKTLLRCGFTVCDDLRAAVRYIEK
ncbi:MAG: HAD family hydrolase [Clostridia bacterium]|nr:HAD family hydrolase [Clostridia bacterium]